MRIISGKYKGKKLLNFVHETTRPTSDKVKEAMFDSIFDRVNGYFLDLFSGTGAVGIEALSRGAKEVVLVDNNKDARLHIYSNLKLINNPKNISLIYLDYLQALKQLQSKNYVFDCIFLDPPYASDYAEKAIEYISSSSLYNENTLVIWEHDVTKINSNIFENLFLIKQKKYGNIYISYLNIKKNN